MRRSSQRLVQLGLLILLAACAGHSPPPDTVTVYKEVPVRIPAGCVVDRPERVIPLNQRIPKSEWDARAPGAHAQSIRAQAAEKDNYIDKLRAATDGCPDVTKPPAPPPG